ncbi:hypothetical protein [Streptomyces sp. PD-S100-1]|uniref:hypothetical protein n=1 Tax=Streptomyces sp. PD-S100-1 TaxID=3394351 RepID=UPI0039BC7E61
MKIFGREPVYWTGFIAAAVQFTTAFGLDLSASTQTAINTIAACIVALITAIVLKTGAVAAALLNLAQAGMALAVGLGLDWSADKQGKVMAAVAALLALWLREKVTAPVPETSLERTSPVKAGPAAV